LAVRRKIRIIIGGVLAGILILLSAGILFLYSQPGKRFVLQKIMDLLAAEGVEFSAASIDYNLAELRVTLNHVVISARNAPNLPPVLRVQHVDVNLGLRKLLQRFYLIESATIRNPDIHLVIAKSGRDNIPRLRERPKQQESKTEFLVDILNLTDGSFVFEDRRQQLLVTLPDWELTVDGQLASMTHVVTLALEQAGVLRLQKNELPLTELAARIIAGEETINIEQLRLVAGESVVTADGAVRNLDSPSFDARVSSTLRLDTLAAFAGAKQQIEGAVDLKLAASGPLSDLKVDARLDGNDLRIDRFRNVDLAAAATYSARAKRVEIGSLRVQSPALAASGSGNLALTPESGQSTVRLAIDRADLERVTRMLDAPVRIASRVTGEVSARFPALQYRQASATARIRLAATREAPVEDVIPVSGSLAASLRGERVTADIASLEALGVTAQGQVGLNGNEIDGQLQANIALEQTLPAVDRFQGKQPAEKPAAAGQVHVTADLDGTLKQPRAGVEVSSPGLTVGGLEGVALQASAQYDPDRLSVKNAQARWREQTVEASGSVGVKGQQPLDLQASSQNLSIPAILAGLGKEDVPATGTLSLAADIQGTVKQPQGTLSLTGSDLSAYSQPLGSLLANATIAGGSLRLNELRLTKAPDQFLSATGTYDLESKQFSANAKADNLQLRQIVLPDGKPVRADLDLSADVAGTVENPKGELNLKISEAQYQDVAVGTVTAEVKLANQQAAFEAQIPKYNISTEGVVGTKAPYPIEADVAATGTNLATLPVDLKQPLTGEVTAKVHVAGDLQNAKQLQGEARVEELDLEWRDQPIRSKGPLTARYSDGVLALDDAAITAANSTVQLDGSIPLEAGAPPGALRVNGTFDLPSLVKLIPNSKVTATGTAKLDAQLRGSLKQITPDLTLAVDDASVDAPNFTPVTDIDLNVKVENGMIREQLRANWASATIESSGTIPLQLLPAKLPVAVHGNPGPASLTADIKGLELAKVQKVPGKIGGTVSAHLDVQAEKPALEALNGTLRLDELQLDLGKIGLKQEGTSTIALQNGTAQVQQFRLTGPATELHVSGTAALTKPNQLDIKADGNFDAALIAAFADDVSAQGPIKLALSVEGTTSDPQVGGFIELADATIGLDNPRVAAQNLNARINLEERQITIASLKGELNGGQLTGGGFLRFEKGEIQDADLNVSAEGVYLEFPEGFRTLSNAKIGFRDDQARYVLGGKVSVIEGGYTEQLTLGRGLMQFLNREDRPELELTEERNPILQRTRFDIEIDSENPLLVDNNLAQLGINLDLRLVGEVYEPGLTGRVTLEEGGELYLTERRYLVERGVITFTNEQKIEPSLDILARTTVDDYEVSLLIQGGGAERMETTVTSDPPLPEPDIIALLLTGRTLEEARDSGVEVAQEQVFSLLAGSLGSSVATGLQNVTGLSQVRLEPNLIANEADPSARLTIGQDITRKLSLVYSMNLTDSSDQIYVAEYDLTRRFITRAIKQEDNSYRMEFRHDIQFGGESPEQSRAKRVERIVSGIQFLGESPFPQERLADKFDIETGKQYDFFKISKGMDRLRKMHAKAGFLESRVRLNREQADQSVALNVRIDAGPEVQFVYEGWPVPGSIEKRVREIWQSGVFDAQRVDEANAAINSALIKDDYLQAKIETTISEPAAGQKRVLFDIQPGVRFNDVEWIFEGADGLDRSDLKKAIDGADMEQQVYTDGPRVAEMLTRFYREKGYLDATVDAPLYDFNPETRSGRVVFPVSEGPEYRIAEIRFSGNQAFTAEALREVLQVKAGEVFVPEKRELALGNLRKTYNDAGYLEADLAYTIQKHPESGNVDVSFQITENRQSIVEDIRLSGNRLTSDNLVLTQLELKPGDPLSPTELGKSRRNLYTTSAYRIVDIDREILNPQAVNEPKRVRLNVRTEEIQPWQLRYGGYFDTDRGPGGIVDISNRLSLGSARVLGFRTRYDSDLREARLNFSQPLLRRFPLKTTGTVFYRRELRETFITDRVGVTAQQETRFGDHWIFNYGYRIERTHTFDRQPDPLLPFDITFRVAPLTTTLSRETRDDILDATRGSFFSNAFEYAPALLGSQLRFIRYFGQYFKYIALSEPTQMPFSKSLFKPRLVYAGAVRVGLSKGLGGQEIVPSEQFFAGGGTSIRGFEQDHVRVNALGQPQGGDAVLIINNELRFPIYSFFDGVGFVDVGNVYPKVSDFSITDVRKTAGLGLRLRTPWFLLRLDYGFKLDRQPGEGRGRFFFSIGQAF
jgi:outer membrane protein assembly complex protein YaeT